MKTANRMFRSSVVGCVLACCLSRFTPETFAIEGLQISVVCSNAVLSWPSTNGETYLVQYRPTLNATGSWTTVADFFPASTGANITFFVHSNAVQNPGCGCGGSSLTRRASSVRQAGLALANAVALESEPMAIPADGSGGAVPLALYPPGFDLTGFLIFDPATGETVNGAGYSIHALSPLSARGNGLQTMNNGSLGGFSASPMDSSGTVPEPGMGFYRVVRDGVHIYGLTNGMVLSGEMQFPIEFAVGSTDQIVGVTFYDTNNAPIIGATAQGAGNHWVLDWNTPMTFNGACNIYAELDFATDTPVISAPVTVTVSNVISFPNYFSRVFGSQMWIYAQTISSAAYQLDLYDENTNYLGSIADYADGNGLISFTWDLTDGNGNTFNSTNFYGVFTVDTSSLNGQLKAQSKNLSANSLPKKSLSSKPKPKGSGSSASANQLWVEEGRWAPNNNWVVACADLNGDGTVDQRVVDMIVGGAGSPTDYYGVLGTLDEYGLIGNLSPGNSAQGGTVFTLIDQASRTNLLNYLSNARYENFYYFGHGNNSAISASNAPQTAITADQLAFALGNVPLSYSILHVAIHPYRFVWLDACDTGAGRFCESFGIPAMTVSTNFFAAAGVESRAFIGYTKPINFDSSNSSSDPNGWPNRSSMMHNFLDAWLSGQDDLITIVQNAKNSFGQYGYKMDSSAIIYGAYDLKRFTLTRSQ